MTRRLYYDDAYTRKFSAHIIEHTTHDEFAAVVLDQTYFYPKGGGQPHDTGTIGGREVIKVYTREEDGAVVHVLSNDVPEGQIQCTINWDRRFDYMQHHTGQHVLTQAFVQTAEANTVGFHLGEDTVIIDLDQSDITPEALQDAEDQANRIIYEDRLVHIKIIAPEEADYVRVRRTPDELHTEGLRVIEIEGFDSTACGGTHVARTGEIGMIKIIKTERRGAETRIEFLCGGRALHDYREKNEILNQLASKMTVGYWEVNEAYHRLLGELKQKNQALRAATSHLLELEAERCLAGAHIREGVRVIRQIFEQRELTEVRQLASSLTETAETVVLFGVQGDKAGLLLARSDDLPDGTPVARDFNQALKHALTVIGGGGGGGQPGFVQGGGFSADVEQLEAALLAAERAIFEQP